MTDPNDKATRFVDTLPDPVDRTAAETTWTRVGAVIMVIGLIVAIAAAGLSQASNNTLDQNTQISAGIAGIAAVCFGGVLFLRYSIGRFLRYWLLRMLDAAARRD